MSAGGGDLGGSPPPLLRRSRESTAELQGLRGEELTSISRRLGRLSKSRWDRWFTGAFGLLLGGVLGGCFGLIPFLTANPGPSSKAKVIYFGSLGFILVVALVCGLASLAVKAQRDDSVAAIKEDLDTLLAAYGLKHQDTKPPGSEGAWNGLLQAVRSWRDRRGIAQEVPAVEPRRSVVEASAVSGALEIIRATYGVPKVRVVDVTATLQALVRDGRLSITADNYTLGGDPVENEVKALEIEYRFTGSPDLYRDSFVEGSRVELPPQ
jgi:hypothetical protein